MENQTTAAVAAGDGKAEKAALNAEARQRRARERAEKRSSPLARQKKRELPWILYDVGNSAFTLLVSAILPIYFNALVTGAGLSGTDATAIWGYAASGVTLCVAVISPILGSFTDYKGLKKPFFFFCAVIGGIGCAALGLRMSWVEFLALFVITKIAYSVSLVFYDAMLPDVADLKRVDIVSSKGYAWGYIGSCIPFILSIVLVLTVDTAISMPIAFIINAVWWLAFTLPLTKSYKQTHFVEREPHPVRQNFKRLASVFTKNGGVKNRKGIILFLVAFFLYIDGVYTVIDMATSFGTALGLETSGLLIALLVTQIVAFPSAIAFGKLAGKVSNELLITISICAYTFVGAFAIFMHSMWQFWVLAVMVGLFQGGIQALSRSYFTKIIPAEHSGTLFGIMDIFGKGAAFIGTLLVSVVTQATDSVNLGAIPIVCLFVAGLAMFIVAAKYNKPFIAQSQQAENEAERQQAEQAAAQGDGAFGDVQYEGTSDGVHGEGTSDGAEQAVSADIAEGTDGENI